jgi:hypothetical protein
MTVKHMRIEFFGGPADGTSQFVPIEWETVVWTQPPPDPSTPEASDSEYIYDRTERTSADGSAVIFLLQGICLP